MGLKKAVAGCIDHVAGFLLGREMDAAPKPEQTALMEAVENARREWQAARRLLDNVTDPRLIDYAIFAAGAAEKRYMYLLDEARRHGLEVQQAKAQGTKAAASRGKHRAAFWETQGANDEPGSTPEGESRSETMTKSTGDAVAAEPTKRVGPAPPVRPSMPETPAARGT